MGLLLLFKATPEGSLSGFLPSEGTVGAAVCDQEVGSHQAQHLPPP